MTPETLHQRILLHELRTILLDETREGDQLPEIWKDALRGNPHETAPYLIMADGLDDFGSDLGELCRIQCELIGLLRPEMYHWTLNLNHPFYNDVVDYQEPSPGLVPTAKLLTRRWEIVEPLYLELHQFDRPNSPPAIRHIMRLTKLGRTTRMLTDVLRYCVLNEGKHSLVQCPERYTMEFLFDRLCREIWDQEPAWIQSHAFRMADCEIHFGEPGMAPPGFMRYDITFTDHACRNNDYETADFSLLRLGR